MRPFARSDALIRLGFDHGFGTRTSADATVTGLVLAKQVHGTRLLRAPELAPGSEADALFTSVPDVAVGVVTADCVPLLLVDRERRGVAAVHAGWRGSAAGIAERSTRAFSSAIGADPADLIAVIGPHIGPCCYEVDAPVREAISEPGVFRPAKRPDHYFLDLWELNAQQLVRAGVLRESVFRVGACTACDPGRYLSYRRDGAGGRMLHFVRMSVP